ncbi:MAG: Ig-like domain-containing protein [Lachnospiraceae bacterium]|nr:Ig-like domain-containing protein [Lachnospiraceae bacterium]
MRKREFIKKSFVKKAVSIACASALFVAGIPSGKAFAQDAPDAAVTAGNTETAATVTGGSMEAAATVTGGSTVLAPAAADCMQKIYENLIKDGSAFTKNQKEIQEFAGDQIVYAASINGNTITITVTGKDSYASSSGAWDYVLEGDYLTYVSKEGDYQGDAYFSYLVGAAADYLGMDSDLVTGYIAGLTNKNLKSDYYIIEKDTAGNPLKYKLYVGGAYDMPELGQYYLDADSFAVMSALTSDYTSGYTQAWKLRMYYTGNKNSVDIYIGEHDALTGLAYQSLVEAVKVLQPLGYEDFIANYKEISEVSKDVYQVSFVTDQEELKDTLNEVADSHYKYIKVHFDTPLPPSLFSTKISVKAGGTDWINVLNGNGEPVKYASSNKKVATVDSNGGVTGLKKGTAKITVTCSDGTKLTCKVTVTSDPAVKIGGKAYKKNKTYTVKKGKTLKAVITGKASTVKNTYQTSKKKIAKIATTDKNAETVKIKGVKKGTSKITIKVNGVSFTFKVKVK